MAKKKNCAALHEIFKGFMLQSERKLRLVLPKELRARGLPSRIPTLRLSLVL
jgi:hypothetical protein